MQLCSNSITVLPRLVGGLTQLTKLWLDWNKIASIPATVKYLSTSLQELKMQGNPLVSSRRTNPALLVRRAYRDTEYNACSQHGQVLQLVTACHCRCILR